MTMKQSTAEIWDALEGVPLTRDDQWIAATAAMPRVSPYSPVAFGPAPDLSPDPLSALAYRVWQRAENHRPSPLEAGRAAAGGYA